MAYYVLVPPQSCNHPFYEMATWAIENDLSIVGHAAIVTKVNKAGRSKFLGFQFKFTNEDDAATFKLKWL